MELLWSGLEVSAVGEYPFVYNAGLYHAGEKIKCHAPERCMAFYYVFAGMD